MGKNNKNGKSSNKNDVRFDAARDMVLAAAGDMIARAVSKVASGSLGNLASGEHRDTEGKLSFGGDPAAKVLRTLADEGPQSIPELLEQTGVGLSGLLHALRDARDFRLVEFEEENETVHLTEAGKRVARNVKRGGIKETASRLLGS